MNLKDTYISMVQYVFQFLEIFTILHKYLYDGEIFNMNSLKIYMTLQGWNITHKIYVESYLKIHNIALCHGVDIVSLPIQKSFIAYFHENVEIDEFQPFLYQMIHQTMAIHTL